MARFAASARGNARRTVGAVLFAAEFAGLEKPESRRGRVYLPDPELVKRYAVAQKRFITAADRYVQGMGRD